MKSFNMKGGSRGEICGSLFCGAENSASFMERNEQFRRYFIMLKNVVKGFEEMMNCVLTVMNESLSDPYAGWNEGEELLMLNEVRCGIR